MTRFDIFEQRETENGTMIVIVRWLLCFLLHTATISLLQSDVCSDLNMPLNSSLHLEDSIYLHRLLEINGSTLRLRAVNVLRV